MILELTFNNYRMFKGSNSLSFSSDTRIKRLLSNSHTVLEKNVLKTIGLYGQNNIGKSNLVELFMLLKRVFLGHENIEFNRPLFGDTPLITVSVTYKTDIDKSWLRYDFSYDSFRFEFVKEKLSEVKFYKTGYPYIKTVYERDRIAGIYQIRDEDSSDILTLLPFKKPLLYCLSLENEKYAHLKPFLDSFAAFADSLEIVQMFNIPIEKTIGILKEGNPKKKQFVLSFVKNADLSISDFFYNDKMKFTIDGSADINEEALKKVSAVDQFKLMTKYGNRTVPSILFDSSGTKKIEAIASYVYETLTKGKTLIIDELDNGLHYKLSRAILSAFNSFGNTKGQLVFTAHDIELITCKHMMRKDQVYFSFRENSLSSNLYCLKNSSVESGGPRSTEDLLKHYNRGEFGYVPSPNFTKKLSELTGE